MGFISLYALIVAPHTRNTIASPVPKEREDEPNHLLGRPIHTMGGEALLDNLRERDPDLKVIAMTGHITDRDVRRLEDYGFNDALPKPFSMEKLIATIGTFLSG